MTQPDPLAASLDHIERLQAKVDHLTALRNDAWAQVLTAAAREYDAGRMDDVGLYQLSVQVRALYGPGWSKAWNQHMPVKHSQVPHRVRAAAMSEPNGPFGSWSGTFPGWASGPHPTDGQAVVYVLYDDLEPVYVGSTEHFKTRMAQHWDDHAKRVAVRWTAHPCADREAAYALERQLLAEHKPRLNKRDR